jgi:hypothetical protein
MLNPFIKQVPIISQAYGFTKTAMKVFNSTSSIEAVKIAALSIIDDCASPQIKYPIKCGIFLAQVELAVSSGGNPWAVAMTIGSTRQIIDY